MAGGRSEWMQGRNYWCCALHLVLLLCCCVPLLAQPPHKLQPAEPIVLPFVIDSNTPGLWVDGNYRMYSSAGDPMVTTFHAQRQEYRTERVVLDRQDHIPVWIESVWRDGDGVVYGWYHHERIGLCAGVSLNVPEIGALVSYDGGKSFTDLGIILSSGEENDCAARNGFFANGHGDFSVIRDREGEYFYFLFGAYGGDVSAQGVAVARLPAGHVSSPVGNVWKYHDGTWSEPGLGGRLTPIFPATVSWRAENTDAFWGPSVHWNTHLNAYVAVMNRSCCGPGWPQEGIYLTMNANLADPAGWSAPVRILEGGDWYPWLLGTGEGESSSEAGARVRFFVREKSDWEIVFGPEEATGGEVQPPAPAEPAPPAEGEPAAPGVSGSTPDEGEAPGSTL